MFIAVRNAPDNILYVVGDLEKNMHTHYIHVVIWGQKIWHNYINMRDYLNTHEEDAKEYADLKERLAKAYPKERIAYTDGKKRTDRKNFANGR